jgi:cytochrome P450
MALVTRVNTGPHSRGAEDPRPVDCVWPDSATPIGPVPDDIARPRSPIQWTIAPNGNGFWLVSDYKLARRVLADQRFRRSDAVGQNVPKLVSYNSAPGAIISLEGAEHTRIRRLVSPAFTEHKIARLAPYVAESIEGLLDGLAIQQAPADFVRHVSSPLPFGVLCHLLGIPPEDREIFGSWVNVLFRLEDSTIDSRRQSIALARYMMKIIAQKRRSPSADLISQLIKSADREGSVTNHELVTLCLSLLMAGFDSTVDQITLCVLTLIVNRPLVKDLSHNPGLIPQVTEELLRINPAPYVTFPRMAADRVSIGDAIIEPGQLVVVSIIASNRDPSAFSLAGEVPVEGPVPAHLTFGHGIHRCLGVPLARLQLTTLLAALVERFPQLRLADDLGSLPWKTGMATRGLRQMHVTW